MSTPEYPESFPLAAWMDPPAPCRPAVLWSWNGAMSRHRIAQSLEGFATRNVGGVYIHPRPGLITEYLSEEWFELWAFALSECERLGMDCHIYDENSFPSGFAGGHVAAADPLSANSRLAAYLVHPGEKSVRPGTRLGRLAREGANGAPFLSLELENVSPRLWNAGFPMVDVCRADVTARFLAETHGRYAARFRGQMGKTIRHVFTDEPETGTSPRGFHLSRAFLREFRDDHGYALESRLEVLCGETPDSPAVRHDYNATLNRLFATNFSRANHDWCEAHGLRFTGHFNEHAWPAPTGSPSTMAAQRWMHAPGLDLLGFQFKPGTLRAVGLWLFGAKEAASVAAQCGRDEVLCESCGGGGYDYGPAQMKPLEDFLLALGVNRIVPHLSHQSLAGSRKYDWPHSISDHSPWWDAYAPYALHVGRVNALLSAGTSSARTLVLNPTTTGWIRYRPDAYLWPDEAPPDLAALRAKHTAFVADLYSAQIEFDLGDECVMAELASADGPRLHVGARAYDTVVVPAGMENMLRSTADLLLAFLEGGGTVLCVGDPPKFIDGRPSALAASSHPRWISAGINLAETLRQRHAPRLASPDGTALPADLLWSHRQLDNGDAALFLANPTTDAICAEIAVEGAAIFECDTVSGEVRAVAADSLPGNRVRHKIALGPGAHALWWISRNPARAISPLPRQTVVCPRFEGCERMEPNVLVLDYCDYEGPGGVALEGASAAAADSTNWHAQGFPQNLWQGSIQFRRNFLDAPIAAASGFAVRYHFRVAPGMLPRTDIRAAVERPWLYEVRCNGIEIPQDDAETWFDEDVRLLPLAHAVRPGPNVLELRARRFHVLAEIKPVILRGDFRAIPDDAGFVLAPSRPWETGRDWAAEGAPFYPGRARYSFAFDAPAAQAARVRLPDFLGSAAGVVLDGGAIRWALVPGASVEFPEPLAAGPHRLDIVLCGNLKNMLGPHFSDGLPGAWSWQDAPPSPPPGRDYRLATTGLSGAPEIELLHA